MEVETKPKVLPVDVWEKLIKKYRHLNLKTWRGMDCLQKANLIHIHFPDFPVYPIFKFVGIPKEFSFPKLSLRALKEGKDVATYQNQEYGGTVKDGNLIFSDIGTENRIRLNDNRIVFHTHPADEDMEYDPISFLDFISFLVINVKSIADCILLNTDIELKLETAYIFTKNEVYVYSLSEDLVTEIADKLLDWSDKKKEGESEEDNFVEKVELLLEQLELYYALILLKYNRNMTNEEIDDYLQELLSYGLLVQRFTYGQLS